MPKMVLTLCVAALFASSVRAQQVDNSSLVAFAHQHAETAVTRGEFETREDWAQRMAGLRVPLVLSFAPGAGEYSRKHTYNIDTRELSVLLRPSKTVLHGMLYRDTRKQPTNREEAQRYLGTKLPDVACVEVHQAHDRVSESNGRTAFGTQVRYSTVRTETFGAALVNVDADALSQTPIVIRIDPKAAQEFAQSYSWRIVGKTTDGLAYGVRAEGAQRWLLGNSSYLPATAASPIESISREYFVPVEVERIELVDGATGAVVQSLQVTK